MLMPRFPASLASTREKTHVGNSLFMGNRHPLGKSLTTDAGGMLVLLCSEGPSGLCPKLSQERTHTHQSHSVAPWQLCK